MVLEGTIWMDPEVACHILHALPSLGSFNANEEITSSLGLLTSREVDVLRLIGSGLANKDISEKLNISLYTVKNHVSKIINKLAVDDRTQAAIIALKEGLI